MVSKYRLTLLLNILLGAISYKDSHYGPGTRPFNIYNIACLSQHSSFDDCQINRVPYYYTGCNSYHEVSVKCERELLPWRLIDRVIN